MRRSDSAARVGLVIIIATGVVRADCSLPRYQPVRDFADTARGGGSINLLVPPTDLTVEKLVCLAQALAKRYELAKDVTAQIFSSRRAAELFDAGGMNLERGDFRRDLRAIFELSSGKSSLTITPIGVAYPYFEPLPRGEGIVGPKTYDTRFELPSMVEHHCRIEVGGRCVVALDPVLYPIASLEAGVAGPVTLSGRFNRAGTLTATPTATGDQPSVTLSIAAIANLTTWRLEPATRETTFKLTYNYVIDPTLRERPPEVQFDLPDRITVLAGPVK